jgi:site-specific recombinase XerD
MEKYGKQAELPKAKQRFHALRHALAVHLLDAGVDVACVQDRLGRVNIQNTMVSMRYTTVTRAAQTRQLFASHRVVCIARWALSSPTFRTLTGYGAAFIRWK